jgi:hypothetical protein
MLKGVQKMIMETITRAINSAFRCEKNVAGWDAMPAWAAGAGPFFADAGLAG